MNTPYYFIRHPFPIRDRIPADVLLGATGTILSVALYDGHRHAGYVRPNTTGGWAAFTPIGSYIGSFATRDAAAQWFVEKLGLDTRGLAEAEEDARKCPYGCEPDHEPDTAEHL